MYNIVVERQDACWLCVCVCAGVKCCQVLIVTVSCSTAQWLQTVEWLNRLVPVVYTDLSLSLSLFNRSLKCRLSSLHTFTLQCQLVEVIYSCHAASL